MFICIYSVICNKIVYANVRSCTYKSVCYIGASSSVYERNTKPRATENRFNFEATTTTRPNSSEVVLFSSFLWVPPRIRIYILCCAHEFRIRINAIRPIALWWNWFGCRFHLLFCKDFVQMSAVIFCFVILVFDSTRTHICTSRTNPHWMWTAAMSMEETKRK